MIMLQYVSYDVTVEISEMIYVLHVNVAKADRDECLIWMLQMFNLDVPSSMRDFNVTCNMKQMLRWIFFLVING